MADSIWTVVVGHPEHTHDPQAVLQCLLMCTERNPSLAAQFRGLLKPGSYGPVWNGKIRVLLERLAWPLRHSKPRSWQLSRMGDLFAPGIDTGMVHSVVGTMLVASEHRFRLFTRFSKRAESFFETATPRECVHALRTTLGDAVVDSRAWRGSEVSWEGLRLEIGVTGSSSNTQILKKPPIDSSLEFLPFKTQPQGGVRLVPRSRTERPARQDQGGSDG